MLIVEHHARLTQQRIRLGPQLEPDDVRPRLGIRWIVGVIALAMVRYELFDLPKVLADRRLDPPSFGRWFHHTRQLAYRRVRQGSVRQRCVELRQPTERTRHP